MWMSLIFSATLRLCGERGFAVPWLAAVKDAGVGSWKPKVLSLVFSATLR
jgi:hypothetical protein